MREKGVFELDLILLYVIPRLSWNTKRWLEINDSICMLHLSRMKNIVDFLSIAISGHDNEGQNITILYDWCHVFRDFLDLSLEMFSEAIQNLSFYPCTYYFAA